MSRFFASIMLAAALAVTACGSDSSSTPTTPTTTSAITPATTALAVTQTQTYTLSATPTPTTTTWVSSNTNALTIDSGGNAVAVGVGAATITATGDAGQTATLTVQTVPLYQGNWVGTATVLTCSELAGFMASGYCARNLGTTQQVTLNLTQSGLTLSGSMSKSESGGLITGGISGTTGINGDITVTGTLAGLANSSNLSLSLISWNSISDGTNMTGTWAGTLTSPQILGLATLQWSLRMTKAP